MHSWMENLPEAGVQQLSTLWSLNLMQCAKIATGRSSENQYKHARQLRGETSMHVSFEPLILKALRRSEKKPATSNCLPHPTEAQAISWEVSSTSCFLTSDPWTLNFDPAVPRSASTESPIQCWGFVVVAVQAQILPPKPYRVARYNRPYDSTTIYI